jgi:hypothetical protein
MPYTEDQVVRLLNDSDRAVELALVEIYNRQTESEKATRTTNNDNGVGFSGTDAATGSYYAKYILSGRNLTDKHLIKGRAMAIKYRKQLLESLNTQLENYHKQQQQQQQTIPTT